MWLNLRYIYRASEKSEEHMRAIAHAENQEAPPVASEIVREIIRAIQSVRFGHVQIIIQDSRVVQIDKTEKLRLA